MEVPDRSATNNRLMLLSVALVIWAFVIFAKLVKLQVGEHDQLLQEAKRQQERKITIPAARGTIFDRNGNPLAISTPADSVAINPKHIVDTRMAASQLAPILGLNQQVLYERLERAKAKKSGFFWVKRHIDPFEKERLKNLGANWFTFFPENKRNYPKHETGSHVLGAVFNANGYEEGAAGIERTLEKDLKGKDGWEKVVIDVRGKGVDSQLEAAPISGAPLTLTIDERLQFVTERELKAGVEAKHAKSGSAIVMDPYTGEIYALANYPTYDPNKMPTTADDPKSRWDLGVSVPFEPGSVFKVITLSAALETTNLRPESPIATGGGSLSLPGRVIHESHRGFGTISMQQVLEKSSNIGAILIGQRVGRENMYEYARRFGIGEKTGVSLPGEASGMLRKLDRWGTTSLASISMGHEVSVTSVQLARACAVIANGGMLVKPKLVLKRGDKAEPTEAPKRVLKPETVMTMRMMMEGVVLRGTAHSHVKLPGYTAAGKTGTAQIFDFKSKHYTHDYNASFMGFTPVTNPRLVIVVTLNGTHGDGGMGAAAAAPVFQTVALEALRMFDVPKDIPQGDDPRRAPFNKKEQFAEVVAPMEQSSVMAEDTSVRELLAQQLVPTPDPDAIPPAAAADIPVVVAIKPAGPSAPDFRGKKLRDVVALANADGFRLQVRGSGVARAQIPMPGAPLRTGERITVVFSR